MVILGVVRPPGRIQVDQPPTEWIASDIQGDRLTVSLDHIYRVSRRATRQRLRGICGQETTVSRLVIRARALNIVKFLRFVFLA